MRNNALSEYFENRMTEYLSMKLGQPAMFIRFFHKQIITNVQCSQNQGSESTSFRQYVQNWNYTYLQNYQMVKFHSKVGFSTIL